MTLAWDEFSAFSTTAAVATDNAVCSSIAKDIMMSAMDAAIAATLCLGVVSPGELSFYLDILLSIYICIYRDHYHCGGAN